MANEITLTSKLAFKKGASDASLGGTEPKDMAGTHYIKRIDIVGATEESIGKGDITTLGYCIFKNVGATGVISVGGTTAVYAFKLDPGECSGALKWATNTIFALGDTAGCQLEMLLLEA